MLLTIYVVGLLATALMCGIQRSIAEEPMKRWEAWFAALVWPLWFVVAGVTAVLLGASVLALIAVRWAIRAVKHVGGLT